MTPAPQAQAPAPRGPAPARPRPRGPYVGTAAGAAEWHGVPALARCWGVSPDTVLRLIKARRLPASKIGRQWKVHVEDKAAYEDRQGRGRSKRQPRPFRAAVPDLVGSLD